MSFNNDKFTLAVAMKQKGLVLTILWQGGVSKTKVLMTEAETKKLGLKPRLNGKARFNVQNVQKTVASIHHIQPDVIKNWLSNSSSGYFKPGEWEKKSESLRIRLHLTDFIHDQKTNGVVVNYYVSQAG